MIVPSIDISGGQAVQLVGGETLAIEAGHPGLLLDRFGVVGEVAVVDIDAARGEGDNRELIAGLCRRGRIRVGGGIRDEENARWWLDAGAEKIIIGTAAAPQLLSRLPRERVIVAVDSRDGEVLSHGWRTNTGAGLMAKVEELRGMCGGFLVTFVEREGMLQGTDLRRAEEVVAAASGTRVTVAGGVTSPDEVAALDAIGADAQVGMALYTGKMGLGAALAALLRSDRADGLWPTVVVDEAGRALGLVYSSQTSLERAIDDRRGVYQSRSRGVWVKGETSGATQELIRVDVDCDRDTLRFTVRQSEPGFCHRGERTCWGPDHGMGRLQRRVTALDEVSDPASNTRKLLEQPELLAAKIREEAFELAGAVEPHEVVSEAADLLYFLMVKTTAAGVRMEEVESELDARERRVTRRPMLAKESPT